MCSRLIHWKKNSIFLSSFKSSLAEFMKKQKSEILMWRKHTLERQTVWPISNYIQNCFSTWKTHVFSINMSTFKTSLEFLVITEICLHIKKQAERRPVVAWISLLGSYVQCWTVVHASVILSPSISWLDLNRKIFKRINAALRFSYCAQGSSPFWLIVISTYKCASSLKPFLIDSLLKLQRSRVKQKNDIIDISVMLLDVLISDLDVHKCFRWSMAATDFPSWLAVMCL